MTETLHQDHTAQRISTLLDRLAPSHTNPMDIEELVSEAQSRTPWQSLHVALLERVEQLDTARDRMAMVLHATDPAVAEAAAGKRGMEGVFEVLVAAADEIGLEQFIQRSINLLAHVPNLKGDLPSVSRLIEISDQIADEHEAVADALVNLAQRIEDLVEIERDLELNSDSDGKMRPAT